jgi:hypothetical protein
MWMFAPLAAFAAEVDTMSVEVGRPSTGIVEGIVEVAAADLLRLVTDCDGTDTWFPDIRGTHEVGGREGYVACAGATDLPWPLADRTWVIESRPKNVGPGVWEIPFAFVPGSGNLSQLDGVWHLVDLGQGRTSVRYEATVDLGFWMPEVLVEWATKRVLPAILGGLEEAAASPAPWLAQL